MDFCNNCFNLLFIKEIFKDNTKKLIYYCKKCDFNKDCNDNKIMLKTYQKNNGFFNNNIEINKLKINDITLPNIKIKCIHCKKINDNKYEIKYYNNSYHKNIICINCYKNITK